MSNLLLYDEEEASGKLDIDELYEKNMRKDLKQLSVFNKILNRVHKRIQTCSRLKRDRHIWFTVPEFIFGEPAYEQTNCISYIIAKLTENGFRVQYMHPNTLFVSWEDWIPQYVRNEVKKKTGKVINEKGQVLADLKGVSAPPGGVTTQQDPQYSYLYDGMLGQAPPETPANNVQKQAKQFTPLGQYKPAGMIYNPEILEKLEKKIAVDDISSRRIR